MSEEHPRSGEHANKPEDQNPQTSGEAGYPIDDPQPTPPHPTAAPGSASTSPGGSSESSNSGSAGTSGSSSESPETPSPAPTTDEQNLAMLGHLLGVLNVVGPLVIWLVKKDESAYVGTEARESLNFHLMFLIIYVLLVPISLLTCGVATFLYAPAYLVEVIFAIIAAVDAHNGQPYRYPFNLQLIK